MTNYIDILLLANGVFCVAPAWAVHEGDSVGVVDCVTGENKVFEVLSVVTDSYDGDFVKLIEKYIGYPLPRITAKYQKSEVEWDEPIHE